MRLTTGYRHVLALFYGLWRDGIPQNGWVPYLFGVGCFAVAMLGSITVTLAFRRRHGLCALLSGHSYRHIDRWN